MLPCVADFTKNRKREKSFLHMHVLFYKDHQAIILTIGVVGIVWLIKGILGTLKPASL